MDGSSFMLVPADLLSFVVLFPPSRSAKTVFTTNEGTRFWPGKLFQMCPR